MKKCSSLNKALVFWILIFIIGFNIHISEKVKLLLMFFCNLRFFKLYLLFHDISSYF